MGGHIDRCDNSECGKLHLSYNSCRNRHCPKCQGHQREAWIQKRESELLNVPYFHVVFTLPDHLNELCLRYPEKLYSMLFSTAWQTLKGFGENPHFLGAKTGMIAVLHTWGQNLSMHPHLHCIVPAGGVTASGNWKSAKNKGKYLFPVKAMSKVLRAKFLDALNKQGFLEADLHKKLLQKSWVTYAKQPFQNPQHVVEYLGRYTHKVAISNHRIIHMDEKTVTFTMKNYKKGGQKQLSTLSHHEFIRRFSLHILPKGLVRIRHYGILSSTCKKKLLASIREQVGEVKLTITRAPVQHGICPSCKKGHLEILCVFDGRGPPEHWIKHFQK